MDKLIQIEDKSGPLTIGHVTRLGHSITSVMGHPVNGCPQDDRIANDLEGIDHVDDRVS
jgi:hypothetical protein